MTAYIEQQSDAAFRAWLRERNPAEVRLDRASSLTPGELWMVAHTREEATA